MDEITRNLAPPVGGLSAAIIIYLWGRGVHRRTRERREAHPAE